MLAQSHRHAEVVKLLTKEMKRKSHWMPPLSELWALLFGGAGDSKGPLLFFLVSVLLWGYPMYVFRVSVFLSCDIIVNIIISALHVHPFKRHRLLRMRRFGPSFAEVQCVCRGVCGFLTMLSP